MFNSEKVLQEIGFLLELNGGRMPLVKLMAELYLVDRLSIEERETSVSGDVFKTINWDSPSIKKEFTENAKNTFKSKTKVVRKNRTTENDVIS